MAEPQELQAELEKLKEENAALKKQHNRELYLKVSQKGAVSFYGLGRFPVTLYKEQWEKLLGFSDKISQFLKDNSSKLRTR